MMITFEIPIRPEPKRRPRCTRGGRAYQPAANKRWEEEFRRLLRAQLSVAWTPILGPVSITLTFYMPVLTKKLHGTPHCKTPDLDNLVKAVLDGINGLVIMDDKQVWSLTAKKVYSNTAGIECHVESI